MIDPRVLQQELADGQKFTDFSVDLIGAHFRASGVPSADWHANQHSVLSDGGVDGFVKTGALNCPLQYFLPHSVFQFKTGKPTLAEIENEILRKGVGGKAKKGKSTAHTATDLRKEIEQGARLVWVTNQVLPSDEFKSILDSLKNCKNEINSGAPEPILIDANKLAQDWLPTLPGILFKWFEIGGTKGLKGKSIQDVLNEPPHKGVPFVADETYPGLCETLRGFFESADPTIYLGGPAGIGKTRRILEAIKGATAKTPINPIYLTNPQDCRTLIDHMKGIVGSHACIVLDDYPLDAAGEALLAENEIPNGCKLIVITNSFQSSADHSFVKSLKKMSEDEIDRILIGAFPAHKLAYKQVSAYCKGFVRMALTVLQLLPPGTAATHESIERAIHREMRRQGSLEFIGWLSLVDFLRIRSATESNIGAFCSLAGQDVDDFENEIKRISQQSGFTQMTDYLMYVSAQVIRQFAIVELWCNHRHEVEKFLTNAGQFTLQVLDQLQELIPCKEKEEMLRFFEISVSNLTLDKLTDRQESQKFMHQLRANPEEYLVPLHALVKRNIGKLDQYPYEGVGSAGRRDLIWTLRDLAQFAEYFQLAEEVIYWLAREEVPSTFGNTATSYWFSMFGPYFAATDYSYDARLNILEERLKSASTRELELIGLALANQFPRVGEMIPSQTVGGRVAPKMETAYVENVKLAQKRLPELIESFLQRADKAVALGFATNWANSYFQAMEVLSDWCGKGAGPEFVANIVNSDSFPLEAKRELLARVRKYRSLADHKAPSTPRIKQNYELNKRLLFLIDFDDFLTDVGVVVDSAGRHEKSKTISQALDRVISAIRDDPQKLDEASSILWDPKSWGASYLGIEIAAILPVSELHKAMERAKIEGVGYYTNGLLIGFEKHRPECRADIEGWLESNECESPMMCLQIWSGMDQVKFWQKAQALLERGMIDHLPIGPWHFLREPKEVDRAKDVLLRISPSIDHNVANLQLCLGAIEYYPETEPVPPWLLEIGLKALAVDLEGVRDYDWAKIAERLLPSAPRDVIGFAVERVRFDDEQLSELFANFAQQYPTEVLDVVSERLLNKKIVTLGATFEQTIQYVEPVHFRAWLRGQSDEVMLEIADQLPRPFLDQEIAIVPDQTLAYFEELAGRNSISERAARHFLIHTFSTGVYMNHGIDLFSSRIELAKKLASHDDPFIRSWSGPFQKYAEDSLNRGRQRLEEDEARG